VSDFPYFPLYPTDLLGDEKVIVQDLTEFGAYMRLLCLAWQRNPPATIPADDAVIAKLLGVTPEVWSGLRPAVIACWQLRGGMYENKRLRSVYDEMIERRHKRQQAGSLGGKQCLSNAKGMLKPTGDGTGDGISNSSLKRKPDSKDAVVAYAVELGLPASDGESVWDKWQGNGFTNGGKPMKDWKAVLRSWKGYGYLPSQKQSKGQPNSRTKGTFNEGKASQYANGYS
jgi:uncharacterized protein YdaU (DUF1376 family)